MGGTALQQQQMRADIMQMVKDTMPGLPWSNPQVQLVVRHAIASIHATGGASAGAGGFVFSSGGSGTVQWSQSMIINAIRATKIWHQTYAGIIGKGGSMKMSEQQYGVQRQNYMDQAIQNHVPVSKQQLASLFKNNVSTQEAGQRFQADYQVRNNQTLFEQFDEELKNAGVKGLRDTNGNLDINKATNFLLGQADKKYYQIWNMASARAEAASTGIAVSNQNVTGNADEDQSLSRGEVRKAMDLQQTSKTGAQGSWSDMAKILGHALPESQIQGYGLTKDDLIQAEFGGPKQAQIQDMMQQIAANANAFATGQTTAAHRNLGSRAAGGERAQGY